VARAVEELLIKHLEEAYATEQPMLEMLDSMIRTTSDPSMVASLPASQLEGACAVY
jgi:ferritin-like metal-binding protein YciE